MRVFFPICTNQNVPPILTRGLLSSFAVCLLLWACAGCKEKPKETETDFQQVYKGLTSLPAETESKRPVRLYFYDGQAALLVPVTRYVPKESDYPAVIFSEMIKGPAAGTKLARAIPEKTLLLGVSREAGLLTIDLSEDVRGYGGGSATEIGLVNSILYAARQIEGLDSVQLKIEGKIIEYLPEGTDISHPIQIPIFDNNYDPAPDEKKFTAFLVLRGAPFLVPTAIAALNPEELTAKLKSEYTYGGLFDAGILDIEFSIEKSQKKADAIVVNLNDSLMKLEKQRGALLIRSLACTVYNFVLARPDYSAYTFRYNGEDVVMLRDVDLSAEGCAEFLSSINLEGSNES